MKLNEVLRLSVAIRLAQGHVHQIGRNALPE
jgi:hypothetical protein